MIVTTVTVAIAMIDTISMTPEVAAITASRIASAAQSLPMVNF